MLEYIKIDVSKGMDKTSKWHESIFSHYYYFFKVNFRFNKCTIDDCQYVVQKLKIFDDAAIATLKRNDCRIKL